MKRFLEMSYRGKGGKNEKKRPVTPGTPPGARRAILALVALSRLRVSRAQASRTYARSYCAFVTSVISTTSLVFEPRATASFFPSRDQA
jgi:hypothetical protein